MRTNDPFDGIPPLGPDNEDELERQRIEQLQESSRLADQRARDLEEARQASEPKPAPSQDEDIEVTKTPRKLGKTLQSALLPIGAVGVGLWLWLSPNPGQKAPEPPQTYTAPNPNDTTAFLASLKNQKVNPPLPTGGPTIEPGVPVAAEVPGQMAPAVSEADQRAASKAETERLLREAQIDAAPLDARGKFKTIKSDTSGGGGPDQQLAHVTARQEAVRAQVLDQMQNGASGYGQGAGMASAGAAGGYMNGQGGTGASRNYANGGGFGGAAGGMGGFGGDQRDDSPTRSQDQEFALEARAASAEQIKVLRQQAPTGRYIINQGTPIQAVLLTGITSDLPGDIRAMVSYDVYDSLGRGEVLIPKGSTLVGKYNSQVVPGQQRLLVAMTRLIRPDGTWISLAGANGTDQIGQSGLEADVNNHFFKIFGRSLILGAASYLLPSSDRSITSTMGFGGTQTGGSIAGQALYDTTRMLMERNKRIAPTLTEQIGSEFMFMAAHDMSLTPYRAQR